MSNTIEADDEQESQSHVNLNYYSSKNYQLIIPKTTDTDSETKIIRAKRRQRKRRVLTKNEHVFK